MINYMRGSVILYPEFSRLSLFTEGVLCLSGILTDGQREVLGAVLNGHNIFFAGAAGSGKSHLVGKISELCKKFWELQALQYVAPGPDEKDANVYFLPQKNSSELKFVLQFTVTFP